MTDMTLGEEAAARVARKRRSRWSWRAQGVTASFALSLASGLYVYFFAPANWNAGQFILAAHLVLGILAVGMLGWWLYEHLTSGAIAMARGTLYKYFAWTLVGVNVALLLTGLANATPLFLYLADIIWFPDFSTFDLVATVHLILAVLTAAGMLLHFILPYGRRK
jgi:hypothetical protein